MAFTFSVRSTIVRSTDTNSTTPKNHPARDSYRKWAIDRNRHRDNGVSRHDDVYIVFPVRHGIPYDSSTQPR
jgi:hypothetical protein